MGWLWTSPSKPDPAPPRALPPAPPSTAPAAAPSEPVDAEMQKFLDLLKADDAPPSAAGASAQRQTDGSASSGSPLLSWLAAKAAPRSSSSSARDAPPAPLGDALSESLLPTEMSCRQAFDLAWSCNSLGGQFNAVYRYGEMRSCSEHWDDFWFCMRTKSHTGALKENMVRAHYREKEHRKYGPGKPSSEDVWEARAERVPPGTAFIGSIEPPALSDDEWRSAGSDRRRAAASHPESGHDRAS